MLTLAEKLLFLIVALASAYAAYRVARRIRRTIARAPDAKTFRLVDVPRRAWETLVKTVLQPTVLRARLTPSLFHAFVAHGFMLYLLVNIGDGLQGYIPGFVFLGTGVIGNVYRLLTDVFSVAVLVGMVALLVRRYLIRPPELFPAANTLVHPRARYGIQRDSAIVGGFILLHVGFRFLGATFETAQVHGDAWQPFATAVGRLWAGLDPGTLEVLRHVAWWVALGLILAFVPYFLYSKHIHIFFAPINFLTKPRRKSMGELHALNFEDESVQQYGAARLEDLTWPQLVDAYACIMCSRCQEACPAHATGKVLSPSALEINKRYQLNYEGAALARGEPSKETLLEAVISPEAVWACTACMACIEICPVGNEPMRDILDIRRSVVLMDNAFPKELQTAYRGMERAGNPWNVPPDQRLAWAEGLDVPTVEQNPNFELLWWVGCAPATEARAQKTARDFARILKAAGVNFAVLGTHERCNGDAARRSGQEYLFTQLATENIATLNEVKPRRIVVTCPHCLHVLGNEYGDLGGHYEVVHHTQLIRELIDAGRLKLDGHVQAQLAYHDPCYLGRANGVYDAPRAVLANAGASVTELAHNRNNSFCCGAGGAQMWKEEEHGTERVSARRFAEAQATGAKTLAVGCPFCMIMLTDAARAVQSEMAVRDVAEIVAENLAPQAEAAAAPAATS